MSDASPERIALSSGAMVAEIGSQGGTILGFAQQRGQQRIEPMTHGPDDHNRAGIAFRCRTLGGDPS